MRANATPLSAFQSKAQLAGSLTSCHRQRCHLRPGAALALEQLGSTLQIPTPKQTRAAGGWRLVLLGGEASGPFFRQISLPQICFSLLSLEGGTVLVLKERTVPVKGLRGNFGGLFASPRCQATWCSAQAEKLVCSCRGGLRKSFWPYFGHEVGKREQQ